MDTKELPQSVTKIWLCKCLYIFMKNTDDLQSDQTGEALEDVYIKTADAVIGQVSVTHKNLI